MNKMRISIYDLLVCLSKSQDLIAPDIKNHHQQVAYLAFKLSEAIGLSQQEQKTVVLAALIHDIGALTAREKFEVLEKESPSIDSHAFLGARLIKNFKPLKKVSEVVKYHHAPWKDEKGRLYNEKQIPYLSHVIHIADRISADIIRSKCVLSTIPSIVESVFEQSGSRFCPRLVETFQSMKDKEYIWLDLISDEPVEKIPDIGLFNLLPMDIEDIIELTHIFSQIIDFRSSFTSRHSAGVAITAERLAELLGFSPYDCKLMLIAGYLHDFGKLAVDNEVLEKPGKLTKEEFDQMRMHTYYTYHLLNPIKQFDTINAWASFHHEKLNGNGYPFHIEGDKLSLGSRIMAVADVFTAITENRPYRKGMERDRTVKVLYDMTESGALDLRIVDVLADNFDGINNKRIKAQKAADAEYKRFMES